MEIVDRTIRVLMEAMTMTMTDTIQTLENVNVEQIAIYLVNHPNTQPLTLTSFKSFISFQKTFITIK